MMLYKYYIISSGNVKMGEYLTIVKIAWATFGRKIYFVVAMSIDIRDIFHTDT